MELPIENNVSLAAHTTLKVGGVADYFVEVGTVEELREALQFAAQTATPPLILGGGSNLLINDEGYRGLVIKNKLKGITFELNEENKETLVKVAAGESWDGLVEQIVEQGLSGLENLSGIPGTVGAAPVQNINAYGVSVGDLIQEVEVFDIGLNQLRALSAKECLFGYRDSIFKQPAGTNLIVTAVTFHLVSAGESNLTYRSASQSVEQYLIEHKIYEPTLKDIRQAILHVRSNIGMLAGQFRSAGSFFKNTIVSAGEFARIEEIVNKKFANQNKKFAPWHWPLADGSVKISTAFLLECTQYNKSTYGSKRWHGVVGISPLHTLSVVTEEGVKAKDVIDFVSLITKAVEDVFGMSVESEVNYIS